MVVPRALIALAVAGSGAAGSTMLVSVPDLPLDRPSLEGSLVHRELSATTVALHCKSGETEYLCKTLNEMTVTFGSITAGYSYAVTETFDGTIAVSIETAYCKVRGWTPYDCKCTWTGIWGTKTGSDTDGFAFSYSTYIAVGVDITAGEWDFTQTPAPTAHHAKSTPRSDNWPTPTAGPAAEDDSDNNGGPRPGVIAGAVVGAATGVALICLVVLLYIRVRRNHSPPAILTERTNSNLPNYESAQEDTIVHVRQDVAARDVDATPPTYEAALGAGTRRER